MSDSSPNTTNTIQRLSRVAVFTLSFSIVGWIVALAHNANQWRSRTTTDASIIWYNLGAIAFLLTIISSSFLLYATWRAGRGQILPKSLEKGCTRGLILFSQVMVVIDYIVRFCLGIKTGDARMAVFATLFALLWTGISVYIWCLMRQAVTEVASCTDGAAAEGDSNNPTKGHVNNVQLVEDADIV